jgi:hypothetical protein
VSAKQPELRLPGLVFVMSGGRWHTDERQSTGSLLQLLLQRFYKDVQGG